MTSKRNRVGPIVVIVLSFLIGVAAYVNIPENAIDRMRFIREEIAFALRSVGRTSCARRRGLAGLDRSCEQARPHVPRSGLPCDGDRADNRTEQDAKHRLLLLRAGQATRGIFWRFSVSICWPACSSFD